MLRAILGVALLLPFAAALTPPPFVPDVAVGFAIHPLAPAPIATAIAFGPGGPDLYMTTLIGHVWRVPLTWTEAGPVPGRPTQVATGFSTPLGLAFDDTGVLYVADSASNPQTGRTDGRVWRVEGSARTLVVEGLPNGRHNTNNLRFHDGLLYITNGNPNDDGVSGGAADVLPLSGAILSVDPAVVSLNPAKLHWRDASNALIPADQVATHPRNADFAAKVSVFASGFRNVYDVAFSAAGIAYTGTNGADATPSQDLFYKIAPGTDYGFPFCYTVGTPGGTDGSVVNNPNYASHDCSTTPAADALLGWHVCATGLDVAPPGTFLDSVYVAECGPLQPNAATASREAPLHATHNTGHKVARVALDANGDVVAVRDFITGLHLPTDVQFGPDGAMYVADADMIYRVVELL